MRNRKATANAAPRSTRMKNDEKLWEGNMNIPPDEIIKIVSTHALITLFHFPCSFFNFFLCLIQRTFETLLPTLGTTCENFAVRFFFSSSHCKVIYRFPLQMIHAGEMHDDGMRSRESFSKMRSRFNEFIKMPWWKRSASHLQWHSSETSWSRVINETLKADSEVTC